MGTDRRELTVDGEMRNPLLRRHEELGKRVKAAQNRVPDGAGCRPIEGMPYDRS